MNCIEDIWDPCKGKVKNSYVIDKEHMKMIFEEEFFKEATKKSYTENWANDYLEICEKS